MSVISKREKMSRSKQINPKYPHS